MGIFKIGKSLANAVDNLSDAGAVMMKEGSIDRDKLFELQKNIEMVRAQAMLMADSKISITKTTICALVSLIVGIGAYKYLYATPDTIHAVMQGFRDFAMAVTPVLGILIGAYGTGKMFNNSKWSV